MSLWRRSAIGGRAAVADRHYNKRTCRMKRGRAIAACVLAATVVAGVAICALRPREPEHDGRRLREWVGDLRFYGIAGGLEHQQAAEALRAMSTNAVPWLIGELHARDSPLKLRLMTLLRKQSLVRIEFKEASYRRHQAALACRELGPAAHAAVPALAENLTNVDSSNPSTVPLALAAIGPEALIPLRHGLTNIDHRVRYGAASALGKLGSNAAPVVPALIERLKDDSHLVRSSAAGSLGMIAQDPGLTVPPLVRSLEDLDPRVRGPAALALGAFGHKAKVAVPTLLELLEDKNDEVRRCAAIALDRIDPAAKVAASVVPALISGFEEGDSLVRVGIAEALGQLGPQAKAAVPTLVKALNYQDREVRRAAAQALKQIDPEAAANEALP